MDREEIIRMALEAGLPGAGDHDFRGGFDKMTRPEQDALRAIEYFTELVAAKERGAIMDEWHMCVQSDLEHGVKWVNEVEAENFHSKYPQMSGFAALIEKRGATDGKQT